MTNKHSLRDAAQRGGLSITTVAADWQMSDYKEGAPALAAEERAAIAAARAEIEEMLIEIESGSIHEVLVKMEILCRWMQETAPRTGRAAPDEGEDKTDLFEDKLRISILRDLRQLCRRVREGDHIGGPIFPAAGKPHAKP